MARALAADPPLLLMDEPFGAIDPINRERLQNELLGLQERLRKTIVFVTHDIDEAIKLGDRIAVLKKGGVLAQYATPAELLMQPADAFVEDFVGADRALKRLALTPRERGRRCGRSTTACRSRSSATRPAGRWRGSAAASATRCAPCASDESLRDALSDLLRSPVELGAVVDDEGRVQGVLGLDVIHELLEREDAGVSAPTILAQAGGDFFRDRSRSGDSCVADNGFCPDWIVHHLDRYVSPFWQHLFLVVVSVGLGFAIAFALALAAHRQRAARRPDHPGDGDPLHDPQPRLLLPAAADHRARQHDGAHRPDRLHAADPLPQHRRRPRRRARGGARRRARHGPDRCASCCGASSCRWRCRSIMAGLRIAATTTVGLAALATFAGAGGLGDQMASQKEFISNIAVGGALCVLMAVGLDAILLVVQRLLTPWTRVRTA